MTYRFIESDIMVFYNKDTMGDRVMVEKDITNEMKTSDGKKRKDLSNRQKSIIRMMVQMKGNPVTVAAISEKLSVSSRTILREMPAVEDWLFENDFRFVRKRGKGLAIEETPENLAMIEELLFIERDAVRFSKDDRRTRLLGTLFFAVSPVKAFVFCSQYDISEGTLYGDLDVLESWLGDYNIKINRRPGLGIFITGEETSRRQAIVNAVFEFFDINRLPSFLDQVEQGSKDPLSDHPLVQFFKKEIVIFAKQALTYCEDTLQVKYVDNSRISLISRISLAVYRMLNDRYLRTMPSERGDEAGISRESRIASGLGQQISETFGITVPPEEIAHLTGYLTTMRMSSPAGNMDDPLRLISIRNVVLSMIGVAERITDIPFRSDSVLIDDLVEHVALMEKRISLDLIAGNSQTGLIKDNYPDIYEAAETACLVLREWIYPKDLKESDIGFIAIHLAAAAERIQKNAGKVAIVVVCPAGIASSKMLAASLLRSFPEIEVRRITSAFAINEEQLAMEGIDMIISTAQINTDFPHLCVDKVLQVQDKMRIRNALSTINRGRLKERINRRKEDDKFLSLNSIRKLAGLGTEITEIVEHFGIIPVEDVTGPDDLIQVAAFSLTNTPLLQDKLIEAFRHREELSDTYIKEMEICLLHCRSDALKHSRFIYISLGKPVQMSNGILRGAVALTVPAEVEDEIYLEPVGRLSALLVEDEGFLKALHNCDQTAGIRYVEKALVKYYQQEAGKIMEV